MIGQYQVRARGEAPTEEMFAEFMVKKHYFSRVGHDLQKMYLIGKNPLREGLFLKVTYTPEQGIFAEWQLFGQGSKNLWVEASARPTKAFKDMVKWADQLKDAAMLLQSDLDTMEKFLRG
jgi:hypothetical protein